MVKEHHPLPRTQRCKLLNIPRSTSYYQPSPVSADHLALMKRIDRIHTAHLFRGPRRIVDALGHLENRKRVRRLMQLMGIQAIHPGPKTSQPHLGIRSIRIF